jgi:glycosyltransferase involved in cell wall biosynthesis
MTNFRILTPAYNCSDNIERSLYSIVGQTYKNWKMTIIDDMSTDDTVSIISEFIKRNHLEDKVDVIRRYEKYGEVRNTYEEVLKYRPNDVVVRLDGSDFITDLGCLDYLNALYEKYDPAVLWTAHRWAFTDNNISGKIDINTSMYRQPWRSSHLKTFRVKDFLGLNKDNFLDEDKNWIMIGCDQAVFLPMMERARRNSRPLLFFPRVMYHYDINLEDPELFTKKRSLDQKMSAENLRERGYIE